MVIDGTQTRILSGEDNSGVRSYPLAAGTCCLYSRIQPAKTGSNEDAAGVIACGQDSGVLAVCDGMGGAPAGATASQIAIHALADAVVALCPSTMSLREAILDGLEKGNTSILKKTPGSATTIIAIEIDKRTIRSYHAGDSAALVCGQRGKVKYQTIAHSPTGYAVESGLLDEEEAVSHDERHFILNAAGSTDMRIEIGPPLVLAQRDTLVVASDGLYDNLLIEEIVEIIRCGPLQQCAEQLANICEARMIGSSESELSKPDDLTFILYRSA